jgi:hypothetical protein
MDRIQYPLRGFFMIVKEKKTDQDPTKGEVFWILTSYAPPKLNQKTWPKAESGKEEDFNLKRTQQIIDREDDYKKRRLTNSFSSEWKWCLPR